MVNTVKENAEALVVTSKETRLEVNADKTQCKFKSRDQNAEWGQDLNFGNSSFEGVEELNYSRTTLKNQNSIQE